ncbi:uncharacterized protein LOC132507970 [Lagenorhynchus albirostris]|uniref:uncharacterized protein LOC132507970 n=1 Tax=Lagenorhynchus albirostris TaxID=27610 RepID=UPI0028E793D1|nr:uncharacterized protein LOC132507970 [Lagenorhynchus albirostris]
MGQAQSTPLSLLLANFGDVKSRGHNFSLDIRRRKLITFCRSEWPTFGVGWPTEEPPAAPPGGPPRPEPEDREAEALPVPLPNENNSQGPAGRTRGRTQRDPGFRHPDSTIALPLREIGPPDETGNPRLQYWPFSTSDLYNWKTQNARFSDNPKDLIALLDSVMFTHQPTWDDCQQLLRILFTTEERERIQLEARKLVPGDNGQPTANPDLINAAFPLTRPPQDEWDYNTGEALQRTHETIWPKLKELYATGPPPTPHQLRPGDWVLVKRHRQETLEPRWKGPYQIILTTPTAIKVDSIAAWIHYTHVKPVDPFSDLIKSTKADVTWTVDRSKNNPLKLTLRRSLPHDDQGTADSPNDSPNPQPSGHEGRIRPSPQ